MKFSLLNDEPVTQPEADLLGTGRAARELARLLHDSRTSTPFTLAVDAGWGMGKSSLMRLVEAELLQREDVEIVWYNAWTSTGADALEGLIKSVLMKFDRRLLRRMIHGASEHGILLRALRATLTVASAPFGMAGLVDQFWRDLSVDPKARNDMRDALRDLATKWADSAQHEPRRLLVVFVDDLDRCSEETVLAVCEAVKVYLDVPGLAFVIGCDRAALGPSGLLRDLGPAGSAFMEKVFQTSYRLPVAGAPDLETYVRRCAERTGLRELLDDDLVRLVADRSARNPRRIKRLINGFGLECALNPVWARFKPEAVIRTLLLQHLYADFYRLLVAGDGTYAHAAREFLEYRTARRVLSQWAQTAPEAWRTTVDSVTGHGLPEPPRQDTESWEAVLARLEEELPTAFPALARDQNFVHLVEEWMALPQVDELVKQLQEGGARPVTAIRAGDDPDTREAAVSTAAYRGVLILWVDDHPENNRAYRRQLEAHGANVLVAENGRTAERILGTHPVDLLISDVARGTDRDAGFTDLASWRALRLFDGPAVFFSGRVTPARERRSGELGARIADGGNTLFEYIDDACTEIRQRQS
ncbi:P-loop NTPase fold protein [Streptomyces sp. ME02-8801-2C]|uniref:P-loop NTPase fold protein n=1 Tax=Streptomyces sp. ME02-8801-2C TaxID=3028680 RepID=UPI0029A7B12F|nr:P-loop NTPase fold protein [Streptomyces sp. ME02-8801-2C]MDX3456915.1 P-loop NTPase fold protein [Streptomyces sp. ME02-8801-2C]